ncbi:cupredoxin domain-containing protein [Arthrobacter sp. 9MFCol3.1]|uniref:cupredoxin domain-containing protein n=1 Tax=Arthrobacter sp. 9MFCol3.1 TaxID=1150398 RepID=UPI0012DD9D6E|nr:cupredoxin domain-containing protein [Arthrobacter sp. 9MFCol3.1]
MNARRKLPSLGVLPVSLGTGGCFVADESSAFDAEVKGGGTDTCTAPAKPGSYTYHCTFHPGMHGTLVVK